MSRHFGILAMVGMALALAVPGALAQTPKSGARPAAKKPVAPPPVAAPAKPESGGIGVGDKELNFFADYASLGDLNLALVGISFGKFYTDNIQLKLSQQLQVASGGGYSSFGYTPFGAVEYQLHPAIEHVTAYVGAGLGVDLSFSSFGGIDQNTYSVFVTPLAGLKYFLSERTAVTYGISYRLPISEETCGYYPYPIGTVCSSSETSTLQNTIGFSIYY